MRSSSPAPARRVALVLALLLVLLAGPAGLLAQEQREPLELLSRSAIRADAFTSENPQWDGRGVVIAVLDTGVDPRMAAMESTTTGAPKILDIRDFSGQGDVALSPARFDEDRVGPGVRAGEGPWLRGLEALSPAPLEGSVLVGYLRESALTNSAVSDLDGNGRSDDVFGVVVYESEEHAGVERRIVVDTDADGRLDDEALLADFLVARDVFTLGDPAEREAAPPLAFALNLWEDEPEKLTFAFDDGAHGSHVAGIAAGHEIGGVADQHGIAPGAQVLSLKIGNNELSGGATTTGSMLAAWRYAARWSREQGVPLVAQMSYGVGSENEGHAAAEEAIDALLDDHPLLVGTVSNGNEGPGLSTAGLPSAAKRVIATGAVMNRASAKTLYGVELPADRVFSFSSRGGESAKPDLVAPGFAASSVPAWRGGADLMRGTSMAAPQAAGAAALVMSAAKAEGLPLVGAWVRQALRRGARPLPGATVLDEGPGMIDVPRAFEVYRALATRPAPEPLDWEVTTLSPEMVDHEGPAIFWRGLAPPVPPERQEVRVTPRFADAVTPAETAEFYRTFEVVSTAKWLRVAEDALRSRAAAPLTFHVSFDADALREPGLYTARLLGFARDLSRGERERLGPEWDLPVGVVVPHRPALGERLEPALPALGPAEIHRVFVHVPDGASAMALRVGLPEESPARARLFVHDPEGRRHALAWVGREAEADEGLLVTGEQLFAGTWELVLFADRENTTPVEPTLSLRFEGLEILEKARLAAREGAPPSGSLTLMLRGRQPLEGVARARLLGWSIADTMTLEGDEARSAIALGPAIGALELDLALSPEGFGLFTDVAVRVLDAEGEALLSSGMGYRLLHERLEHPAPGSTLDDLVLAVEGALAEPGGGPATLRVERRYLLAKPVELEVAGGEALRLFPDRERELSLEALDAPPTKPEGAGWIIEVTLPEGRLGARSWTLLAGSGEVSPASSR